MVECAADGRDAEEVPNIAIGKAVGRNGYTVDIGHCRNKGSVEVVARKRKVVCRDQPIVVDAPTDADVYIVVANAVSESNSIAKDRIDIGHNTETPVIARSRSSESNVYIDVTGQGKIGVVRKPSEANAADKLVNCDPNEVTRDAARPRASLDSSSDEKYTYFFAFRVLIQELQAEIEDLLTCRAESQKIQIDTLLKLCSQRKKSGALESQVKV